MFFYVMPLVLFGVCALQVAGRLHVEVERVIGGPEREAGGGDSETAADGETQERKFTCVVG